MLYFDMHCHLDFASNTQEVLVGLNALGVGAFAVGVLPRGEGVTCAYQDLQNSGRPTQDSTSNDYADSFAVPAEGRHTQAERQGAQGSLVRWGVGLHPWWVASGHAGEAELEALLALIEHNTYVGEVGLDFGKTHGGTVADQQRQLDAFSRIATACAQVGGRVLSIHAVAAAPQVLHILQDTRALETCTCIFHWYSGDGDTLHTAVQAGCLFSIGSFMLETKRGREYARQIPLAQLLLETDYPPQGQPYDVDAMQQHMAQTCRQIARLRGLGEAELAARIAENSRAILQV